MRLGEIAVGQLRQRPGRSFMTLAGVSVAIAALVAFIGLARGIEQAISGSLSTRGTDVVITEGAALDFMSSVIPDDTVVRVRALPFVVSASLELAKMTTLESGASVLAVGWPPDAFSWQSVKLVAGHFPSASDRNGVVIGKDLAARNGFKTGDAIEVFYTQFKVTGLIDAGNVINNNLIVGLMGDFQPLTNHEGMATSVLVQLKTELDDAERLEAVLQLRKSLPGFSVEETGNLVSNYIYVRIARILAWSISAVALVTAVLGILNTMAMAVNERRHDFAIMQAIGWPRRRIIACVLIEGCLLAGLGGLLGSVSGVAIAWAVSAAPAVAGFVQPMIDRNLLLQASALSLVVGLIGSLLPAWNGTSIDPGAVLRGR